MIQQSLQYLRNDEDSWVTTVLIGGILTLLSPLVIPAILVLGYLVRVVRETMHGNERPPAFDEWGDLFSDGLRAFIIVFVYGFVPTLVAALVIGGGVLSFVVVGGSASSVSGSFGPRSGITTGLGILVVLVGSLLAVVVSLLAAYVGPVAMASLAERDDLSGAFSLSELRPALTFRTYATAWVSGLGIILVFGLIAGALSAVPLFGFLAAGFLSFYGAVAAYCVIGHAWGELHDVTVGEENGSIHERPAV
ncbi:MAG: DUF4013 domain-containing protein [Halobellus sp.]|uniref:DUF4013 domain-containing protein n=1 Tax=Halobellus sp. TaxID=1979212 RepID=UPI0035D3FBD1